VQGEIKDGEQLRQGAAAQEFAVSRIPVREALRQLEVEGLITIVPHRGAVVSLLSCDEIEKLFEIPAILEAEVLRASIPNLKVSDLKKTEQALDHMMRRFARRRHQRMGTSQLAIPTCAGANRPQFINVIRAINYKKHI